MPSRYERLGRNVRRFIRDLGGRVLFVANNDKFNCPFNFDLGVDWATKTVYWRAGHADDMETIVGAIHEAGHIFVDDGDPASSATNYFYKDEIYWLGWEIVVAEECGISLEEWAEQNAYYSIGSYFTDYNEELNGEIQDIDIENLPDLRDAAINRSRQIGIITDDFEPISRR